MEGKIRISIIFGNDILWYLFAPLTIIKKFIRWRDIRTRSLSEDFNKVISLKVDDGQITTIGYVTLLLQQQTVEND